MKIEIFELQEPIANLLSSYDLTARQLEMFAHAQALGPIHVGTVDGNLVACWGIIPPSFMADSAYIWMWAPPIHIPTTFIRHSRTVIATALERYGCLYGHCEMTSSAQRWLQWLGAEFGQPQQSLIPFEIRRV